MHVIISPHSGFCPGVKEAETRIFATKKLHHEPIYVYGDLIHNKIYIQFLKEESIHTVQDYHEIPHNKLLAIRAHGIDKKIENHLKTQYQLLDLTCCTVKKLQLKIQEYSDSGYFIIITGKKNHPEVNGLKSYAKNYFIFNHTNDYESFQHYLSSETHVKSFKKIVVLSQTTGCSELLNNVYQLLKTGLDHTHQVELYHSICPITSLREEKSLELLNSVDFTFVIGDKKSSNANKLFKTLVNTDKHVYFVEDLKELLHLNLNLDKQHSALVSSSSSTPGFVESEIVEYLRNI